MRLQLQIASSRIMKTDKSEPGNVVPRPYCNRTLVFAGSWPPTYLRIGGRNRGAAAGIVSDSQRSRQRKS